MSRHLKSARSWAIQISEGGKFWADRTSSTKILKHKFSWCVQGTVRNRHGWMGVSEHVIMGEAVVGDVGDLNPAGPWKDFGFYSWWDRNPCFLVQCSVWKWHDLSCFQRTLWLPCGKWTNVMGRCPLHSSRVSHWWFTEKRQQGKWLGSSQLLDVTLKVQTGWYVDESNVRARRRRGGKDDITV